VSTDLDLSKLSHAEKDALILSQLARLDAALKLIAKLQARIDDLTRLSPCRLEGAASISVQTSPRQRHHLCAKQVNAGAPIHGPL
jgi:hypothetical protein